MKYKDRIAQEMAQIKRVKDMRVLRHFQNHTKTAPHGAKKEREHALRGLMARRLQAEGGRG